MPAGEGVYVPVILPVISVIPIISEPCPGEDFVLIMYLEINECNLLAVARAHHAHTLVSGVREVAVGVGRGQDVVLEARGDLHPPSYISFHIPAPLCASPQWKTPTRSPCAHGTMHTYFPAASCQPGTVVEPLLPSSSFATASPHAGTRLCCSEFSIYLNGSPFELSSTNQLLLSTLSACPECPKH